jgi:D-alanyl-D-alanine carboxypeptidase/Putative peptidoglycan binding domain
MALTTLVPIPPNINSGLTSARQATMLALLGSPRSSFNQDCQPVTHPVLKSLIVSRNFGGFHVNGLRPAVDSLEAVLADVRIARPDIFAALGTAGMLCARNQRNSSTAISNHSWGTAIDLTLNGVLDSRGDGKVQRGLAEIFPIFNHHGWYWGAAFGTEDGMHFEVSEQMIRKWASSGLLSGAKQKPPKPLLVLGDRGPEVALLQQKLNTALGRSMSPDGVFGHDTFIAVVAFQGSKGLTPDGAVGAKTWDALG